MRGKSNGGQGQGKALTGAERYSRAQTRLSDARQQLAGLEQMLADGQRELEAQASMEASAARDVQQAEKVADQAAAAVVDAHSELLISEETPDEATAKARHAAALEAHEEARLALDMARATLADLRERTQRERATVGERMEAAKAQRKDVARAVASFERAAQAAHAQAGEEAAAALRVRHAALQEAQTQARAVMAAADEALSHFYQDAAAQLAEWPHLQQQAIDLQAPVADADLEVYGAALAFWEALYARGSQVSNRWWKGVGPEQRLAFREAEISEMLRSPSSSMQAVYQQRRQLLKQGLEWAEESEAHRAAQRAAAAQAGSGESQGEGEGTASAA